MKQIVVLSGKGGTGKTSVAAALAHVASQELSLVAVDADTDAANLGLMLAPVVDACEPFYGEPVAMIDTDACLGCEMCADVCRFDAIESDGDFKCVVDPVVCEGCGACLPVCQADCIELEPAQAGWQRRSNTLVGRLFDGDLFPGQENSGKLVAALRGNAKSLAASEDADWVLIDGPPGIGCPAIAACTGADLAILVCEPSLSALHDLERILNTTRHFSVPAVAVLNKADLHEGLAERIHEFLEREGVPLLEAIPYHPAMHDAVEEGRPVTLLGNPALDALFSQLFHQLRSVLEAEHRSPDPAATP